MSSDRFIKQFWLGVGQLFDFFGSYTKAELKNRLVEIEGDRDHWRTVGDYLRKVMYGEPVAHDDGENDGDWWYR
jgi:hypothetical protein